MRSWEIASRNTGAKLFSLFAAIGLLSLVHSYLLPLDDGSDIVTIPARPSPRPSRLHRLVYNYSVVDGGLYVPDDLKQARELGGVAAKHYADFGRDIKWEYSSNDLLAYVSFRKNGRIYWTAQKVRIGRGELLLTDGTIYARARCGNRISTQPQLPTLAQFKSAEFENLIGSIPEALLYPGTLEPPEAPTVELPLEFTAPAALIIITGGRG